MQQTICVHSKQLLTAIRNNNNNNNINEKQRKCFDIMCTPVKSLLFIIIQIPGNDIKFCEVRHLFNTPSLLSMLNRLLRKNQSLRVYKITPLYIVAENLQSGVYNYSSFCNFMKEDLN
jgi:hypothetical protein